jgi:hypothetical protein
LVEVEVCADELPVPALAEVELEVDVCELLDPEPDAPLVDFVDELVEVEACAPEPDESPAEVEEVVPVFACAVDPPLAAWLPVAVVVPVWAFEAPDPA